MVLARSHIVACILASIVIMVGAIPVSYTFKKLYETQDGVVQIRNHEAALQAIFDIRSKAEKHLLNFAATALDLDAAERKAMLRKSDQQLRKLRQAALALNSTASAFLTPQDKQSLNRLFSEIFHNWEEVHRSANEKMSNYEKTWHFLSMVDNYEKLNKFLVKTHGKIAKRLDDDARGIFSDLKESAIILLVLMGLGTLAASIGIGASSFFLTRLKTQAKELLDNYKVLKEREDALSLQADRFSSAIENMAQGLCMVDKDRRLITWNAFFADMYAIPQDKLKVGLPLLGVLDHRVKSGSVPTNSSNFFERELHAREREESQNYIDHLPDGRYISVSFEPTPEGGFLSTHQDVTERHKAEEKIFRLAHHDSLTDLFNRRRFMDQLNACLEGLGPGDALALLTIDLDRFKSANDMHGHPGGDFVLKTVAERLENSIRDGDFLARLGGDEFAVILTNMTSPEAVMQLASRIVEALSRPYFYENNQITIGASIGAAMAPCHAQGADSLLKMADIALYQAKRDGRGQSRLFTSDMLETLDVQRQTEDALFGALERNEFELHYQPVVDAETQIVVSMEALIRWQHPQLGTIAPLDFIPIAENAGLMGRIGAWVIGQACKDAAGWPEPVCVAVNVSAQQFHAGTLELDVVTALSASGIAANRLELELTETILIEDRQQTVETLHNLKALGVGISIDDFGTGYSSLSYVNRFPINKIKIDRSFVKDLPQSMQSVPIIKTIVALASALGMSTVAEGVETEEQSNLVRDVGCNLLQGNLFSKPTPADRVEETILELNARAQDIAASETTSTTASAQIIELAQAVRS